MKHYKYEDITKYEAIVIANGSFPKRTEALSHIDRWIKNGEQTLACCDGAVNNLSLYTDKLPDVVIGDLDSISPNLKTKLAGRLIRISEQETNDLSKTIRYLSSELNKKRVILLGATGKRDDHTLGNLALLPCCAGLLDDLVLITETGYFRLIQEECTLEVKRGTQVSFFNFAQTPLTIEGVHWPLDNYTLPHLWSGTLNRADEDIIKIYTESPILVFVNQS